MKGLDTNILVRYFVQDDPVQGEKATQFIEKTVAEGETCFINNIVLCELVWVLESAYDYSKEEIADLIEKILRTSMFNFEIDTPPTSSGGILHSTSQLMLRSCPTNTEAVLSRSVFNSGVPHRI